MNYADAIAAAGLALARARSRRDSLKERDAAVEAHQPGGPSVVELAGVIYADRHPLTAA